ncbi:MAG TPA: low affinity iron permease family protein [Chloroflexia bacterium]|nr:low affinity iron permease family protein [Chloroflexia bacterium]
MQQLFNKLAKITTHWVGTPLATVLAFLLVLVWFVGGFFLGFSDTYQLYINTGTTIVTFLMVFLIQNTQNRDTQALQIKMDEVIRATRGAHNALLDLEELSEKELLAIRNRYEKLAAKAREAIRRGEFDIDTPDVEELLAEAEESKKEEQKDR